MSTWTLKDSTFVKLKFVMTSSPSSTQCRNLCDGEIPCDFDEEKEV